MTARIEGATIVLSCPTGRVPVQVRYGWQPFPEGNLVNGSALPASKCHGGRGRTQPA